MNISQSSGLMQLIDPLFDQMTCYLTNKELLRFLILREIPKPQQDSSNTPVFARKATWLKATKFQVHMITSMKMASAYNSWIQFLNSPEQEEKKVSWVEQRKLAWLNATENPILQIIPFKMLGTFIENCGENLRCFDLQNVDLNSAELRLLSLLEKCSHLRKLAFASCTNFNSIAEKLFALKNVQAVHSLDFSYSHFEEQAETALVRTMREGRFTQLQTLKCQKINKKPFEELLETIKEGKLAQLQHFSVPELSYVNDSENFLKDFCTAILSDLLPELRLLDLSQNKIEKEISFLLTKALFQGKLSKIKEFIFYHSHWDAGFTNAFSEAIRDGKVPNIQILNFMSCEGSNAGLSTLFYAIADGMSYQVQVIVLSSCEPNDKVAIALGKAISSGKLSNLKKLVLSSSQIGDVGMTAIGEAIDLADLPRIEEWHFYTKACLDQGLEALGKAITNGRLSTLTRFSFCISFDNWKLIGENLGDTFSAALLKGNFPHLRILELENMKMSQTSCQNLGKAVGEGKLIELSLSHSLIRENGVIFMEEIIKGKKARLQSLNLNYNEIDDATAVFIIKAIHEGCLPKSHHLFARLGNCFSREYDRAIDQVMGMKEDHLLNLLPMLFRHSLAAAEQNNQ